MSRIHDEYTDRTDLNKEQKWALRNPEKNALRNKKKHDKLRAKLKFANPFYFKEKHLFKTYNLTFEEFSERHSQQDGKCLICSVEILIHCDRRSHRGACVDHNHEAGQVRGLLCNHCNRALGLMKENKESILNMVKYLEKYER